MTQATELARTDRGGNLVPVTFSQEKVDLLKRTICKGATNDELELFIHASQRTGLDPFARQIYAIKRWEYDAEAQKRVERMTIQTGIDGYRLIAERTGRYMPGPKPTYEHDGQGNVVSATASVKKLGPDGQWHTIEADAYFSEYASFKKDGGPTRMWSEKPHVMLTKCAEALALRRAFPAELSGVYTAEEMAMADHRGQAANEPPAKAGSDDDVYRVDANGEPDLSHDPTFLTEYDRAITERKAGRAIGRKFLSAVCKKNHAATTADLPLAKRRETLDVIRDGRCDESLSVKPATAKAAPSIEEISSSWDSTLAEARRLAKGMHPDLTDADFRREIDLWLVAAGHENSPNRTNSIQRVQLLDMIREDMVAWGTALSEV